MNKKPILLVVLLALLGALMFGITHLGGQQNASSGNTTPPLPEPKLDTAALARQWPQIVAHAAAPPRGNPHARWTIAEFGDFQCPQCGKARPLVEKLLAQYPEQVNLIFVHRPFPFYNNGEVMHQWALPSAQASQAAAKFGKFWPMYDALYSHQDDLEPGFYADYAAQIGIPKAQFQAANNDPSVKAKVNADWRFTEKLGIVETPTFLLRDNQTGTVSAFVGTVGTAQQPGIQGLAARPPWLSGPVDKAP